VPSIATWIASSSRHRFQASSENGRVSVKPSAGSIIVLRIS
jgi:hypothetical protein